MTIQLSIIIPVYQDKNALERLLIELTSYQNEQVEIIVVDGYSDDDSINIAKKYTNKVISSPASRAKQMNAGAAIATGKYYWFVHADSHFLQNPIPYLLAYKGEWARFTIRLNAVGVGYRIIEQMMNWRTCITKIVTGDHAMIIEQTIYKKIQGFDEIALMEDIAISKKLKLYQLDCFEQTVITSARRWQKNGIIKTILFMWLLRLKYFLGVHPEKLKQQYYPKK